MTDDDVGGIAVHMLAHRGACRAKRSIGIEHRKGPGGRLRAAL
jgi:hypothetical protein